MQQNGVKMNWPNRLSLIRIFSVPVLVFLMYGSEPWCRWAALAVFILASLTDFLDGYLARKHQWITDFGKFIDPLADKMLVLSAFMMLTEQKLLPAWFVVLILARELSVDGLRLVAMTQKKVIAAGKLGKIKTTSQMILIILIMIFRFHALSLWFPLLCTCWVAGITLWSGIDYFVRNRSVFSS